MTTTSDEARAATALADLNAHGYTVIENVLDASAVGDVSARVQQLLDRERATPFDPGPDAPDLETGAGDWYTRIWELDDIERCRLAQRQVLQQRGEFDTPWPVPEEDVCISFIHVPTFFDGGRSQRVFNLINKDVAFAPLLEHPIVLGVVDNLVGRDAVLLDASVNAVGANTPDGGWHIDSPLTQLPEPLPNLTLSVQVAWMVDDFREDNGATHVASGSHLTLRQAPRGHDSVDGEVVIEGPAGSLAMWLSQTWHRHSANTTSDVRRGVIVQYGRSWIKPFVDLRTPMTQDQARQLSPRLRYMMGCNASAPVRG